MKQNVKDVQDALRHINNTVEYFKDRTEPALELIKSLTYDKLEEVTNQIVAKQEELNSIEEQYKQKEREVKADWNIRMKEDKLKLLIDLCKDLNYATMTNDEVQSLKDEISNLNKDMDVFVEKTTEELKKEFDSKFKDAKAEFELKEARLVADLENSQQKELFLSEQNSKLQVQLDKAQEANIKIAEASKPSYVKVKE